MAMNADDLAYWVKMAQERLKEEEQWQKRNSV
nr:MAG TPA: hypothetical protein [Caudoviricetes sp.]DAI47495.1 MAG TPA: hypothetical protein [Caudoviricetes sp.]